MTRRHVTFFLGAALVGLLVPAAAGHPTSRKEETVILEISGMTWGSCVATVQSALESVKGVKSAKVSLEKEEAEVKYDPDQVKVEDLIKSVKEARGMSSYDAKVKKSK